MSAAWSAFTAEQQAAIRRLYLDEQLPAEVVGPRLQLPIEPVINWLRAQGLMRRGGGSLKRLPADARERMIKEMPTTRDAVLSRRYGLGRQRVGFIRHKLGLPSSRLIKTVAIPPDDAVQ